MNHHIVPCRLVFRFVFHWFSLRICTWCILETINNRCTHITRIYGDARSISFYSLNNILPWLPVHQSRRCTSIALHMHIVLPATSISECWECYRHRDAHAVDPCMSDVTVRQSARCSCRRTDAFDSHGVIFIQSEKINIFHSLASKNIPYFSFSQNLSKL